MSFLNQNRWRYGIQQKRKSFILMWIFKKKLERSEKSFFRSTANFLPQKTFFFKSKQLKIWNFGKNEKVSSWCKDFKKKEKTEKVISSAYSEFIADKYVFFLNQNHWRYESLLKKNFLSWWDDSKNTRKIQKKSFFWPTANL